MSKVVERFLKYVSHDTQSKEGEKKIPSTDKQFALANALAEEMKELGLENVTVDGRCYVYGFLPETAPGLPTLGFIAHMDTSPEVSGKDVLPRILYDYPGGDIYLNRELSIDEETFPAVKKLVGQDLIVTDGKTLLGADDKAGIAEIMTMCEALLAHPEIRRGRIAIGFTPDEEVGAGADGFDVKGFGADFAYTVDGGALGELEYENFNACSASITVHGASIHPGSAKNKMKNAIRIGEEFDGLLPAFERPEHTEGYEGFFHLLSFTGKTDAAELRYIVRDHNMERFEARKKLMRKAAEFINLRYGEGTLTLHLKDSYYNMKEKILPHFHLIETAKTAMEALGIAPEIVPVRGGTDGARLSYMGLPCPNLCTGGYFFHGPREMIPVQSLEKVSELLVEIVKRTYEGKA
ncbi:MAG TPA: peptidase T [Clostridia bacterium]|nr:peptidase T [Clostridia bacterium]